ncbi:MAG: hypothetical protein RIN55_07465 [Tissierellaceae bacterium]|nr:hypothetical protein [Tissierellaceae bacterium]
MEKIILLLILLSGANKDKSKGAGILNININEYIDNMEVNTQYTEEKIRLAKKIVPWMPLEYINPINRSIYITESVVRIMELKEYMDQSVLSVQTAAAPIPIEDNRERISKIASVIQEEVPRSNMQTLGSVLELVVNLERYKKMFDLLNTFMKSQSMSKDTDKLVRMVEPMMKGKGSTSGDGSLDIEKLMNIMSILSKTKENTPKKENKDITQNKPLKNQEFESEVKVSTVSDFEESNDDLEKVETTETENKEEKPNEI